MTARTSVIIMPSEKMWKAILLLAQSRADAIKQEAELVRARKKLDEDLNEMGSGPKVVRTDEWRNSASALKLVERTLEQCRSSIRFFADKLNVFIEGAAQGRLFDDEEVEKILKDEGTPDAPLFEHAMKEAVKIDASIGEPEADAAARDAKPDPLAVSAGQLGGIAPDKSWRDRKLVDEKGLKLKDGDFASLRDAGLITAGDVARFLSEDGNLNAVLGRKAQTTLVTWLDQFQPPEPKGKRGRGK